MSDVRFYKGKPYLKLFEMRQHSDDSVHVAYVPLYENPAWPMVGPGSERISFRPQEEFERLFRSMEPPDRTFPEHEHKGDQHIENFCTYTRNDGEMCGEPIPQGPPPSDLKDMLKEGMKEVPEDIGQFTPPPTYGELLQREFPDMKPVGEPKNDKWGKPWRNKGGF